MRKGTRTEKQKTGSFGEALAERFLRSKGFMVLSRNYRRPWGEIDIIAEKGNVVRFIEVKAISYAVSQHHLPEDMVDERKLAKLARTAVLYMEESGDNREFQIDVVGVILDPKRRTAQCRFIEQAL